MQIQAPKLLDIPDKLLPILSPEVFNKYRIFLIDGGRVSGKSHTVARFVTYLADSCGKPLRIFCGREIQASIDDSVYALFVDIIRKHDLNFKVGAKEIDHNGTGAQIRFRGFREHGAVNIKGLEGVDILWVDEAQQLKKETIDIIMPTIRKDKAKLFFTLNRTLPLDPIMAECEGRKDVFHVHIDYFENKHCPQSSIDLAEACKARNMDDYRHIWLGQPRDSADNAAFRKVEYIINRTLPIEIEPESGVSYTLGVDLARSIDFTVLTVLDNRNKRQVYFERMENENRTSWNYQKQKILAVSKKYNNALIVPDASGVGDPIVEDLIRMGGNVYHSEKEGSRIQTPGSKFSSINKENMVEKLKVAIETRLIELPYIKIQHDELVDYRAILMPSGNTRYACPDELDSEGNRKHDDCVTSLMLALWGSMDAMYSRDYVSPTEETHNNRFWKQVKKELKSIADDDAIEYIIGEEEGTIDI